MNTLIRVCKNIYESKKRACYVVRIAVDNKIYQKSFGYTKDGQRIALQKAIKYKRDLQTKLSIQRQSIINYTPLIKKNKWLILEPNIYHNEIGNTIIVSIRKDNVNKRKTFSINTNRPYHIALLEAKRFKNSIDN
ncbi:MAG: hypothetical protein PHC28_12275 [Flavobacterium sp.]|uniref:hypothetical protein n=1 Tax=Flavobacterium sp. TaxID=239 RepID=UPI002610860F|nr:hypothetical protein [Flavobacterium sp.]MDD5151230.1 hypothetical protein [Flavobacterium sp.]